MVMATEYDSHLPRIASQATNSCVPPPFGADQRGPAPPIPLRELGQGDAGGGDVVDGCVAARVPGPQPRGHRLSGAAAAVVDTHQRVVAVGFFQVAAASCLSEWASTSTLSRSTVTCPPASGDELPGQLPHSLTDFSPGGPDRGEMAGECRGRTAKEVAQGAVLLRRGLAPAGGAQSR